jgi:Ni,Fe-hydrogenase III large subunit
MTIASILAEAPAVVCRPWLRHILPTPAWRALIAALAAEPHRLLALWADTIEVHALLLHEPSLTVAAVSTQVSAGSYPALSPARPGAAPFERMIRDLWGHTAEGGTDLRPWLDHGHWPVTHPLSPRPAPPRATAEPPTFPEDPDDRAMRWPIGPVRGLLDDAAHLRLTLGEAEVRGTALHLGYTHKGSLALLRGKSPRAAARFVARLSADSTVAHAIAFARATEAALDIPAPPRAEGLRALMQAWEAASVHLGHLAALGAEAAFPRLHQNAELAREWLARAAEAAFGHRLLMDVVVPGGVTHDIAADGQVALRAALAAVEPLARAIGSDLRHAPLAARLDGLGRTPRGQVRRLAAGGVVGAAAGRGFRTAWLRDPAPDDDAAEPVPPGDAAARYAERLSALRSSLVVAGRLSGVLPDGPISVGLANGSGEGIGCADSVHGDIWHWIRLDRGQIAAIFPRDPAWALWPLVPDALAGTATEDVALVLASLGLTVSGIDL